MNHQLQSNSDPFSHPVFDISLLLFLFLHWHIIADLFSLPVFDISLLFHFYLPISASTTAVYLMIHLINVVIRSPDISRIRAKMLYATSKERFRRELDGVHYEIQATDPTEMDLEVLRERAH